MLRTRSFALLLPLALGGALLAAPPAGAATTAYPSTYTLPGDAVFPEGIAAHGATFYVSSTTDGSIYRGTVGSPSTQVVLPGNQDGRTTAIGLALNAAGTRGVIAGGPTGKVFVYDTTTGRLVNSFSNGASKDDPTFLNDVDIAPNGDAYVTDSTRPVLYRIPAAQIQDGSGRQQPLQVVRSFAGTALQYQQQGINANGIVVQPDGQSAIIVQSNTGKLFRAGLNGSVVQVDLGGQTVLNGDGLALSGDTLYVVRNADGVVAKIALSDGGRRGELLTLTSAPTFRYPTTAALVQGRLLLVNSQFDKRGPGLVPQRPFTVSGIQQP